MEGAGRNYWVTNLETVDSGALPDPATVNYKLTGQPRRAVQAPVRGASDFQAAAKFLKLSNPR